MSRDALCSRLSQLLDTYANETGELLGARPRGVCQEFQGKPTALEFLRLVSTNTPAVFRGAGLEWPAMDRWKEDGYLIDQLKDQPLSITVTPDGRADAIIQDRYFALPATQIMSMTHFSKALAEQGERKDGPVLYLQSQNGNMSGEYEALADDVPQEMDFCSEALGGQQVDARNFWMGNHRSVTSLHKDPYENVYGVVCGHKVFTLYPPSDYWCLHEKSYPVAEYRDTETWELSPCKDKEGKPIYVPWIPVDPDAPLETQAGKYPRFQHANPIRVTLAPGDLLYLPALWYHHVRQLGPRVLAVNWWYDMQYGANYTTGQLIQGIVHMLDEGKEEKEEEEKEMSLP